MIGIECENPEVERSLRKLERVVTAAGGWLNGAVTIIEEGGGMGVETDLGPRNHELLLSMPIEVLLPMEAVEWRLEGEDLAIASFKPGVSRTRQELFEAVVEIYNLTGKIAAHRRRAPRLALANDSVTLKVLLEGRVGDGKKGKGVEKDSDDPEQAVIRGFLDTRVFDFEYGKEGEDRRYVLMPFNDFLNHHHRAPNFQSESAKHPGRPVVALVNSRPVPDSRECFVQYGIFDAYDLFLNYAYVPRDCPFVRSVPLTIELEGLGKIEARSVPGMQFNKELPVEARDLGFYMPMAAQEEPGKIILSHLIIPGPRAPHALRRVLAGYLAALDPALEKTALMEFVKEAERRVLAVNVAFYERLRERVRASREGGAIEEIYAMAEELAEVQLARLAGYAFL